MQAAGQMILVVEDEPPMLDLLKEILEAAGYRVLTAKDGIEAVEIYGRHQKEVALVYAIWPCPSLAGTRSFCR